MIDQARFDDIKRKHGGYASWAIWAPLSAAAKSNMGDLRVLTPRQNPSLFATIRTGVVMVGLNISRPFAEPFRNFHDPSPWAHDYKIRFAFSDTPYYGAYMTDVIKNTPLVESALLLRRLRDTPELVPQNVSLLRRELSDLGSTKPLLLAFGRAAYDLVIRNLPPEDYSRVIKLTHYSHRMAKERYRDTVRAEVDERPAQVATEGDAFGEPGDRVEGQHQRLAGHDRPAAGLERGA